MGDIKTKQLWLKLIYTIKTFMGLIEPYKAKKYRENGSSSHLITASHGKTLYFLCTINDDKKIYSLVLENKNDKVVFEAELKEDDILELAKSISLAHELFKIEE
jgi:hypothetical protein